MVVNASESQEYIVAPGYANNIGECVAIINCDCGSLHISWIITGNESCRCGESAASGSSNIKKPPLPILRRPAWIRLVRNALFCSPRAVPTRSLPGRPSIQIACAIHSRWAGLRVGQIFTRFLDRVFLKETYYKPKYSIYRYKKLWKRIFTQK